MSKRKILFIDRDGTLIHEPADQQIDTLEKLRLAPDVIPALLQLQLAGYTLVMVSNQDGLGTASFPEEDFTRVHEKLIELLQSQGITFESQLICPHLPADQCECRKPRVGLVLDYLRLGNLDRENSYVIGDRASDLELSDNMGIPGIQYREDYGWLMIAEHLLTQPRVGKQRRVTKETIVDVLVNLDRADPITVDTGIGFFDHMLEQLAKHGGFSLCLNVKGDLQIDEHHTVEDTALALGQAFRDALGDKVGIGRYGFLLPMDEALAQVAIDLSGRSYVEFSGEFPRQTVGEFSTEMVPHFFRSFADTLQAALHIQVTGENTHHMIEACFKSVGRALRQAIQKIDTTLPTTKGIL